jgi:hypothetical protein
LKQFWTTSVYPDDLSALEWKARERFSFTAGYFERCNGIIEIATLSSIDDQINAKKLTADVFVVPFGLPLFLFTGDSGFMPS